MNESCHDHSATHYHTLQHAATRCNTLQHAATQRTCGIIDAVADEGEQRFGGRDKVLHKICIKHNEE